MQTNHRLKHFLFKYYALIAAVVFVSAVLLISVFSRGPASDFAALGAVGIGIWSFAYGVQKQHLEEVRLFRELFKEFNERYDQQNEKLNRIYCEEQPDNTPFTPEQKDILYNYFNLCGEEHLYFQKGFIYPEVWQSWENGMKFFRRNRRIERLWDEELRNDSYYDLKFRKKDDDCPPQD